MNKRYDESRSLDVISMGRVAVDLYSEQIGAGLDEASSFRRYLGGCAGNIAVGSSRLGLRSALLSCTGDDDMGRFLRKQLQHEGVDQALMATCPDHLTGLVLLGVNPPDHFPLIFYRDNCADMQIDSSQCDTDVFAQARAFLLTGTCLSTESMRQVSHHATALAKQQGCAVVLDIDYRPVLWGLTAKGDGENRYVKSERVSAELQALMPQCDVIVGTEEEYCIAGGSEHLDFALQAVRELSGAMLVVKRGDKGCQIFTHSLHQALEIHGFNVDVLNVLGAGDAFISGFLRGWLRGQSLTTCGIYANACGALAVSRHGCSTAIPSYDEMRAFIANHDQGLTLENRGLIKRLHARLDRSIDSTQPMLICAFDHRIQFESSCYVHAINKNSISAFKHQVYQGFLQVAQQHTHCAMILDSVYGERDLFDANQRGIDIGVPIELAGSMPVNWLGGESLYHTLLSQPKHWFVKVLWHFHPAMDYALRQQQMKRLIELNEVCCQLGRQWMLELIIPDDYPANGSDVCSIINQVYANALRPSWWKMAPLSSRDEWHLVAAAIHAQDALARIVLLGGNCRDISDYAPVFALAKQSESVTGFAIGRSVFWQAWVDWCEGTIELADVSTRVALRFEQLVEMWASATKPVSDKEKSYVKA